QSVVGEEGEGAVDLFVDADVELLGVLRPRSLVLVDVAERGPRADEVARGVRERRVDVARAQDVARVVGRGEDVERERLRELARQDDAADVRVGRGDAGRELTGRLRHGEGAQLV